MTTCPTSKSTTNGAAVSPSSIWSSAAFRRIAYIGGQETSPSNQIRLLAYQQTLQENGLIVDPQLISFGGFRLESGYERVAGMMQLSNPPMQCSAATTSLLWGSAVRARTSAPRAAGLWHYGF